MIEKIYKILSEVYMTNDVSFSGVGIIVCDQIETLPIHSIYSTKAKTSNKKITDQLLELSNYKNKYHDGFHVLSSKLELTNIAQYFYPKPLSNIHLDVEEGHGVRYFVAKIGSTLPGVLYTAIIGNDYGVCIFQNGEEVKEYND